jgi:hypothetical protein
VEKNKEGEGISWRGGGGRGGAAAGAILATFVAVHFVLPLLFSLSVDSPTLKGFN